MSSSPEADQLERRGRRWLAWSFLFCPCHLPVTLTVLATVAGSTAIGVTLRQHPLLVGILVTAVWLLGTTRGLVQVRRADTCRLPARAP